MDDTATILLLALMTAGLLVWGLYAVFRDTAAEDKKRLHRRLSGHPVAAAEALEFAKVVRAPVVVTGVSAYLIRIPGMEWIHRALEQIWPTMTLAKFIGMAGGIALAAFFLVAGILDSLLLGGAAALLAAGLPIIFLNMRCNKRVQTLNDQLPESLDFLGRILRSGHSLSTGLQMVGEELPEPLAAEFRRAYAAHSLGRSLDDALKETALRVNTTDFGFFVTAVLIQRQTGGDLAEVLDNISDMIRSRLRLQQSVRAKTAEGRLTGYILTAFPVVMFVLTYALNPAYASVLLEGTGLYVLGAAAGMCMIGLFFIRKITQIRV